MKRNGLCSVMLSLIIKVDWIGHRMDGSCSKPPAIHIHHHSHGAGQSPRTFNHASHPAVHLLHITIKPEPRSAECDPMTHTTGTAAGHRPQSLYWDPSQQATRVSIINLRTSQSMENFTVWWKKMLTFWSCLVAGVLKSVPEITNMTNQGLPQRSYSLPVRAWQCRGDGGYCTIFFLFL